MKAIKAFIKPSEAPQRSVEIQKLTWFLFQYKFQKCTGWEGLKDLLLYLKYVIMFDVANFVDIPCLLSFINV